VPLLATHGTSFAFLQYLRSVFGQNRTMVNTVVPYLCCKDASGALEFYKKAFGAMETLRMPDATGRISHAEFKIGEAGIMLADEHPEIGFLSPQTLGGTPVVLVLTVPDVDALFTQAVSAGATAGRRLADQPYGRRSGELVDPFGHRWDIGSPIEPKNQ
jgi:PhnB protein